MRYQVYFSVRGDQNAANVRFMWADTFTSQKSALAYRQQPEHRWTNFAGTVTDICAVVEHLTQYGENVGSCSFGPVRE